MRTLALKIDVDTFRGTQEGVPRLQETLQRFGVGATFLWSLGPDHTGRAIKRIFRRGFLGKIVRTSIVAHYGIKTLLYGVLLPGPDIGKTCDDVMHHIADAGFENGIHAWDHTRWQDGIKTAGKAWTEREMKKAAARYQSIFGSDPSTAGAAGWQMNHHAYRLEGRQFKLRYASDTRGTHPFWPIIKGELTAVMQLPTTLPTLDELIGTPGCDVQTVHTYLLEKTAAPKKYGHVYTAHAELEGMALMPVFKRLLAGWIEQDYHIVSLGQYYDAQDHEHVPYHHVKEKEIPGRSGTLAVQAERFPTPLAV